MHMERADQSVMQPPLAACSKHKVEVCKDTGKFKNYGQG